MEQIKQRLAAVSDGNLFEEFAAYALQSAIPGLAPVSGGGDFGRDGEAPGAVLTCTIQSDVIGNMTKSLEQYKKTESGADTVYVATNQSLTNQQKDNLRKRAKELGFNLPTIYDAPYFTNELYRDSDWLQKLLGVSGAMPALSVIPINTRKSLDIPMIGRAEAMEQLEMIEGDALISGQPGSGKTYLAADFAERNNGLFVVSSDATKIAGELRQKTPAYVFVDDVHSKEQLLDELKYIRTQQKLDFRIVGTTWTSGEAAIKANLGIGDDSTVRLRDLTRDQIVEVINASGLKGATNILKREIVNQAKGKPGLAITLSALCLSGDWEKVFNGDSLYNLVTSSFDKRLGKNVTAILSIIALGGDGGISLASLAEVSGSSVTEIKSTLDELAFGGVISSKDDGTVRVVPDSLRYPLVRDLFISGSATLPFERYLDKYESKDDVIETLLVTVLKGATMDSDRIAPYIDADSSQKNWAYYAALGQNEAEYVATNNPDAIVAVPEPILTMQPEVAVRALMIAAIDDHRELNQHPSHPARVLHEWADGAKPGSKTAIKRRKTLLKVTGELLDSGYQDSVTAGRAIGSALNPHYQATESDPGIGTSITFIQGYLSPEEFQQMPTLFDMAKALYPKLESDEAFMEILTVVDDWVYNRQNVSTEYLAVIGETKKELAQRLLIDLRDSTKGRHLIQRRIRQLGNQIGMNLEIEVPKEYEIIFPYESRRASREEALSKKQLDDVRALANDWSGADPLGVVEMIARLQRESSDTRTSYPNYLHHIPQMLAEAIDTEHLIEWSTLLAQHTTSAQFTASFADEIAKRKPEGYREILMEMLAMDVHQVGAMQSIIMRFEVNEEPELFELSKPLFSKYDKSVNIACLRGEVSPENELFILENVTEDAAIEICEGINFEYSKDGDGNDMPEELSNKLKDAVVGHSTKNYQALSHLKHILRQHPEFARPWFEAKINLPVDRNELWQLHLKDVARALVGTLSAEERAALLTSMNSSESNPQLATILVGNDPALYKVLVNNSNSPESHLAPLNIFSTHWAEMANLALEAGHSAEEIKENSHSFELSWSGSEHAMWLGKLEEVKTHLDKTDNPDILQIVNDFIEYFETRAATAKEQEYRREVTGI